jgi:hypothetical protein
VSTRKFRRSCPVHSDAETRRLSSSTTWILCSKCNCYLCLCKQVQSTSILCLRIINNLENHPSIIQGKSFGRYQIWILYNPPLNLLLNTILFMIIQGDLNVCVHLMITIQKFTSKQSRNSGVLFQGTAVMYASSAWGNNGNPGRNLKPLICSSFHVLCVNYRCRELCRQEVTSNFRILIKINLQLIYTVTELNMIETEVVCDNIAVQFTLPAS